MQQEKSHVRSTILDARRSLSAQLRESEARDLGRHLATMTEAGSTVCAYVPVGSEPGSPALLDELTDRGVEVLLPVARHDAQGTPLPLQWGRYRAGELVKAPFGLREPGPPWLAPETLARAAVILVPALAVDLRGVRLGRGAGFYDRTLGLAAAGTSLVAVVRDDELVDRLPSEPHDVRMTHALTPQRGLIRLRE